MAPIRWLAALVVVVIATLAASAGAERAVEVYKVQHRMAEELLPFVQTALAGRGNAVVDDLDGSRGHEERPCEGEPSRIGYRDRMTARSRGKP